MQKTIFCDIDGCLIEHQDTYTNEAVLLQGTLEKIKEWDRLGHKLILTTGRRESARKKTEKQLRDAGISYDQLVMGLGPNQRIIINDLKPGNPEIPTAVAINLLRNDGIKNVKL